MVAAQDSGVCGHGEGGHGAKVADHGEGAPEMMRREIGGGGKGERKGEEEGGERVKVESKHLHVEGHTAAAPPGHHFRVT